MRSLSVRVAFLLMALSFLAVGWAYADSVGVQFPSDNSLWCNTNGCDFIGNTPHHTGPLYTSGDFVTEIFFTGQPYIEKTFLVNIPILDNFGGNPGAQYLTNFYVNSSLVGSFLVPDCNYCNQVIYLQDAFSFPLIQGDGTYALSFVLAQTVPAGDGYEEFGGVNGMVYLVVPEPSTTAVLGSGLLVLVGLMRRKLLG